MADLYAHDGLEGDYLGGYRRGVKQSYLAWYSWAAVNTGDRETRYEAFSSFRDARRWVRSHAVMEREEGQPMRELRWVRSDGGKNEHEVWWLTADTREWRERDDLEEVG